MFRFLPLPRRTSRREALSVLSLRYCLATMRLGTFYFDLFGRVIFIHIPVSRECKHMSLSDL